MCVWFSWLRYIFMVGLWLYIVVRKHVFYLELKQINWFLAIKHKESSLTIGSVEYIMLHGFPDTQRKIVFISLILFLSKIIKFYWSAFLDVLGTSPHITLNNLLSFGPQYDTINSTIPGSWLMQEIPSSFSWPSLFLRRTSEVRLGRRLDATPRMMPKSTVLSFLR